MTDPRDTVEPGAWWKREQMGRPRPATPMSEAQPETAAGRRLLADLDVVAWFREPPYGPEILAIEADARAALLAELRAAVEGLPVERIEDSGPIGARGLVHGGMVEVIGYANVLALLDPSLPVPEPLPQGDGLDVERLAAAIHLSHAASMDEVCGYPDRPDAIAIAAEYARLTPSRPQGDGLERLVLRYLRSARTRRIAARALGGGEKPSDEYLRMATAILSAMADAEVAHPLTATPSRPAEERKP